MSDVLVRRLNQIEAHITRPSFLAGKGLGNEIAVHIFEYDPQSELRVREHIKHMSLSIERKNSIQLLNLNMLNVVVDYLRHRNFYNRVLQLHSKKGDAGVIKALRAPMAAERIRDFIASQYQPDQADLFLLHGVGSVWPLLRSHSLLNALHSVIGDTPLVLFYPGSFDDLSLTIFNQPGTGHSRGESRNYYRAFPLLKEPLP